MTEDRTALPEDYRLVTPAFTNGFHCIIVVDEVGTWRWPGGYDSEPDEEVDAAERRAIKACWTHIDQQRRKHLEEARDAMCEGCRVDSKERPLRLPEDGFHYPGLKCRATPIRELLASLTTEAS